MSASPWLLFALLVPVCALIVAGVGIASMMWLAERSDSPFVGVLIPCALAYATAVGLVVVLEALDA